MKKFLWTFVVLILSTGISCKEKIDIEKEKGAIISVIEEEKDAYFDGDLEKINSVWKHDSTSRKVYMSPEGSEVIAGWSELSKENEYNLREERGDFSGIEANFTNYEINVSGKTAMVYHDALFKGLFEGEKIFSNQERILHLVKVNGIWKIDQMIIRGLSDASKQLVKNGMVCCWNYTLNNGVQDEEFERFMINEFIPAFKENFEGIGMILVKGERGENMGRYRVMLILDSVEERNEWWPGEGKSSEKYSVASEKMTEIRDKLRSLIAEGTFTDWVIL